MTDNKRHQQFKRRKRCHEKTHRRDEGGEVAAILFSLVHSCKASGVNLEEYLTDVMKRLMGHSTQKLHELLSNEWAKAKAANAS
ncbi:MAG: transposase domain-containing protein [Halobacteriovoraceae bacterium]|nr:transposase domain-containing protein [Halobacteriovoraceae bacterium]